MPKRAVTIPPTLICSIGRSPHSKRWSSLWVIPCMQGITFFFVCQMKPVIFLWERVWASALNSISPLGETHQFREFYGMRPSSKKLKKLEPCKSLILLSISGSGSKVPRFQRFLTGGRPRKCSRKSGTTRCNLSHAAPKILQKGFSYFFTGTLEPRHFSPYYYYY